MTQSELTQAELRRLADRFQFYVEMTKGLVAVFEEGDWRQPASDQGGNTAHWLLGHLAAVRRYVLRHLGGDAPQLEWEALFDMGAKPTSTEGYPSPEELLADMEATSKPLAECVASLSPEKCAEDWGPQPFPDGSKDVLGGLYFFQFHEAYHMGQLGMLRRITGKAGIV